MASRCLGQKNCESTRLEKLRRIRALDCTHYIDDLAEILEDPTFPDSTEKSLFAPAGSANTRPGFSVESSWRRLTYRLFGNFADDVVCRISQKRYANLNVDRVTRKPRRRNSIIFELESSDRKRYTLGVYLDGQLDLRPRLKTEFLAPQFLEGEVFPVTLGAAKVAGFLWVVYNWVLGITPSCVDNTVIDRALESLGHLRVTSQQSISWQTFE